MKQALAAGKHVVCEKPLAMTSAESGELLGLAEASGLVHCTNFNIRFYPMVQEARARVRAGRARRGLERPRRLPAGLAAAARPTGTGASSPSAAATLRAVGDIGSHWLDLVQFVTRPARGGLFADLATTIPVRRRPLGEVETYADAGDIERADAHMTTEDLAHILLRFEGGMRGSLVVSQVSAGRKNSLRFELDGSRTALAWDSERHEELWLGHREQAERGAAAQPRAARAPRQPRARTCRPGTRRVSRTHSASSTAPSTRR